MAIDRCTEYYHAQFTKLLAGLTNAISTLPDPPADRVRGTHDYVFEYFLRMTHRPEISWSMVDTSLKVVWEQPWDVLPEHMLGGMEGIRLVGVALERVGAANLPKLGTEDRMMAAEWIRAISEAVTSQRVALHDLDA